MCQDRPHQILDPLRTRDQLSYENSMTMPPTPPIDSLKVSRLETHDVASCRELRLEANTVFGGWVDSSPLVGVAGFRVEDAVKLRHKGVLWGMYVRPEARRTGLGAALVKRVVEYARTLVEELCLTVVASNTAACRLYSAAGFKEYGLERRALKVGSEYYDELLMALPLLR